MVRLSIRLIGMTALLATTAPAAVAQNATNEAWIGQTGDTNTIAITQTGIGNSAGANAAALEINQDGRFNSLVIDQFGLGNKAGAAALADPAAPQGINQVGDRNFASVSQKNDRDDDGSSIGAIYQNSSTGLSGTANSLTVEQNGEASINGDADGERRASHSIGFVSQTNSSDGLDANIVKLLQSGGLNGIGNSIERVIQTGYANSVLAIQTLEQNVIGSASQTGHGNAMTVLQGEGEANAVEKVTQDGTGNQTTISQSGDRNYVISAYQNNALGPIAGNTLAVTLAGNDNGGDGLGGPGAFTTDEAKAVSVFHSTFTQIGGDNDIRLTVNGGNENQFGVSQIGDGNGAIVAIGRSAGPSAIVASNNEVATTQIGDGNSLSVTIVGGRNATGSTVDGNRNSLWFDQTGDDNKISTSIQGDDNNNSDSLTIGGFTGNVGLLAASLALTPGQGLQSGKLNHASIKVVSGNGNLFAFTQHGDGNAATFDLTGVSNQSLISQAGDTNSARIGQNGTGNSMAISQF